MKMKRSFRRLLLFWCFFIGLGAVWGATAMFIDPSGKLMGMDGLLPGLRKLPFADVLFANLVFSGIALLIVNGLTQLASATVILMKKPYGAKCGLICGVLLMLWITIQFFIFPFNALSTGYFIFGALEALTAWLFMCAEKKKADTSDNSSADTGAQAE